MQVWKRRVVALVAAGVGGTALLMSSAGAQTTPPTSIPEFTIPDVPDFPDFTIPDPSGPPPTMPPPTMPPPTMPPPTMPPSTTVTTSPPPTMPPPTTLPPPPTMPPTSISVPSTSITIPSDTEALVEGAISRLEEFGDEFSGLIDEIRRVLDLF